MRILVTGARGMLGQDVVNTLVKEPSRIPESLLPERKRDRNISGLLRERLPADILALLKRAGNLGHDPVGCILTATITMKNCACRQMPAILNRF